MAVRYLRDQAPSSYLLHIQPFSELLKSNSGVYVTSAFEASGYKCHYWFGDRAFFVPRTHSKTPFQTRRLVFFQRGYSEDGGKDHISMYVRLDYTNSLPQNWELNVELKIFIKNQTQNKFLTVQDADVKQFNEAKKMLGFAKMLPLSTFDDSRNGYLVNDSCIVGADVFVVKPFDKRENVTFISNPSNGKFTWRISKFSKLDRDKHETDIYTVGETKWQISIHPKGYGDGYLKGKSITVLLWRIGAAEDQDKAGTYVRMKLRLLDQINSRHYEREYGGYYLFLGEQEFITLKELKDPSRGLLVNDKLIVEADMEVISVTKNSNSLRNSFLLHTTIMLLPNHPL